MKRYKKVLVTGGGGFIGSHLCEMLLEVGYDVSAFIRYNSRKSCGWLEISRLKNDIKIITGDIRDFDSVDSAVGKVDAVCHLAALIGIPYSYTTPLAYIRTNVEGTYNVLEAARRQGGKRVVHTSTSETYGTAQYTPIDEKHPVTGQSPYSATKIAADQLALSYALSFDLPVTVIRPFNTYGPRQSMRAVIPTIIAQIAAGNKVIKLGNLKPTRDLTFVTDTAKGLMRGLETDSGEGRVINLGTGKNISILDLSKKIMDLMGRSVEIMSVEERNRPVTSEVDCLLSSNALAGELLNWTPEVSLEQGLQETIEFVKSNISSYETEIYGV